MPIDNFGAKNSFLYTKLRTPWAPYFLASSSKTNIAILSTATVYCRMPNKDSKIANGL